MRPPVRSCLRALVLALLVARPPAASAQATGPLAPDEEASLQQIRDFVLATAQRYRMVAPLEVSVASWVGNPSVPQYASTPAVYTRGALHLNRRLLRASNRDLVIAIALAYEMLRGPGKATTLAEHERERAQMVLDGNARAVDILDPGQGAVRAGGARPDVRVAPRHAPCRAPGPPARRRAASRPCDAIADLLRRYPGLRSRSWDGSARQA